MKKNRQGGVIILGLLGVGIFSLLLLFLLNFFSAGRLKQVHSMAARAVSVSSARIWADGLESMQAKWIDLLPMINGVDSAGFYFSEGRAAEFQAQAEKLNGSLNGYASRTKAVMTVVADAYGLGEEAWTKNIHAAGKMGLTLAPAPAWVDGVFAGWMPQAWIKREYDLPGDSSQTAAAHMTGNFDPSFSRKNLSPWAWKAESHSAVALVPGSSQGKIPGGFPDSFQSGAAAGGFLSPGRSRYRAMPPGGWRE